MATKKQLTNSDMKDYRSKGVMIKNPYDTFYDLTLFAFRSPEFIASITWRDYLCHFKSTSKTVCLPSPHELDDALFEFSKSGFVDKMFAIPMLHFQLCHGCDCLGNVHYAGNVVIVNPGLLFYCNQFLKAYAKFYETFNPQNYIIK